MKELLPKIPSSLFSVTVHPPPNKSVPVRRARTGLVVTTFDRPRLLRRLLATLSRAELSGCLLMLVDDASAARTKRLVKQYRHPHAEVITALRRQRNGCQLPANLRFAWDTLVTMHGCERLLCLDADTLVQPDFLVQVEAVFEATGTLGPRVVSGFNTPAHPVVTEAAAYSEKASLGGANLYFDVGLYASHVRETLSDMRWDHTLAECTPPPRLRFFTTKPSAVQHTGRAGYWSSWRSGVFDYAPDYPYNGRFDRLLRQGALRARHRVNQWSRWRF